MKKTTLLVVEDESAIRDMIRFSLPANDFEMFDAENTAEATRILADKIPDIIILDWMLPGNSGIEFVKWLKHQNLLNNIPIIMLTAKAEEENKVKGLETGVDDYMTKPFSPRELIARIRAILRRGLLIKPNGSIQVGNLILNTDSHEVTINGQLLSLTPNEYRLLHFFMTHPGKTYTRDQLITRIWGGNAYIYERSVDVQIRRLRDQLKKFSYQNLIKTIRGMGYQFSPNLVGESGYDSEE